MPRSGPEFFGDCDIVRSPISGPDRIAVQTGLDCKIILRSGLKIQDRTAYKSVQSGPVPVLRCGPVSLLVQTGCSRSVFSLASDNFVVIPRLTYTPRRRSNSFRLSSFAREHVVKSFTDHFPKSSW